jgi:capsular polysaccharide biosynthesis protein
MIDLAWNIEAEERDADLAGSPRPLLGTWHYLRKALRRGWRVWLSFAVLGAYAGLAVLALLPPSSTATVTLLMAHPAALDATSASGTDVSLLASREVAVRAVRDLGTGMSPDAFQSTVSAEAVTNEILKISVSAADNQTAVARANAVTKEYLAFRSDQLRSLSSGLISGYASRIAAMQKQISTLNQEYGTVSQQGLAGQTRAAEILTQRAELNSQVTSMQQASEDSSLQTDAAISSTHVVDSARAVRPSIKRALVLDLGSGVLGGGALGAGLVLFRALTSERLRRRQDVALALSAPVRFSVTSPGPAKGRSRRVTQRLLGRAPWRRRDLEALVYGLGSAILPGGLRPELATPGGTPAPHAASVGVAAVGGNAEVAAAIITAVASHLRVYGLSVFLVDLSATGALVRRMPRADASSVFRPTGVPGIAIGPDGTRAVSALPVGHPLRESWEGADVVIALVEVDPGLDVENLRSWVDQVIPLVTAGASTAELLETTAELLRAAGLAVPFAMMVGADDSDQSLGLVDYLDEPSAPLGDS